MSIDPKQARSEERAEAAADKARSKSMRPWYKKKRFVIPLVLVILIILGTALGGGDDDEGQKVGTAGEVDRSETAAGPTDDETDATAEEEADAPAQEQPAATEAPAESEEVDRDGPFVAGDIVQEGDFEATVLSVNGDYKPTNQFEEPDPGRKLVGVEFQLKNSGDESEQVSTLLQFKLKDSSNAQYDINLFSSPDPRFPDGELAAGDTSRGWIGFDVPADAGGLKFLFDSAVFGGGRITWTL